MPIICCKGLELSEPISPEVNHLTAEKNSSLRHRLSEIRDRSDCAGTQGIEHGADLFRHILVLNTFDTHTDR